MKLKTNILLVFLAIAMVKGQFPTELASNQSTDPSYFTVDQNTEYLLTLTASANTNWAEADAESATLTAAIDGEWV